MSEGDAIFEPRQGSMQTHAVGGAFAIGLAQLAKIPFQAASLLILPRLLQPIDYGIYAMVDSLVSIGGLLLAFGMGQALVQAPTLKRAEMSGLFWIMASAGALSALLMLASAPLVADFFNEPRAGAVAAFSSIFLFIAGLSNVPEALLARQMKFGWLALIGLAGVAVGFIVSLIAALMGASYWSLSFGYGATALVTFAGAWAVVGWLPREKPAFSGLTRYFRFGGAVMSSDAATMLAREADAVLLGRFAGGVELGYYDRGSKLTLIPVQRIHRVLETLMVPILSRLNDEPARYRWAYLRVIRQLMLWMTPGTVAVGVTAPVLIPFLIGEQWAPTAPIFAWLALAALHRPVSMSMNFLFISQGRARDYFIWSLFSAATSVAAVVVGLRWGALGVAISFALSDVLLRLPALWWWVSRKGPVSQFDLYRAAAPFAAGSFAAFAALLALQRVTFSSDLFELVVSAIVAYAASWGVAALFPTGRKTLADTHQLARTELPRLMTRFRRAPPQGSGNVSM
jgi:PST family polysaccharide transporter